MAQSAVSALKLFAVAASETRGSAALADGTEIVQFRGLCGVVERAEYAKVDVNAEELAKYLRIVEEVHTHTPALPAPPGTVFRSRENLTRWLELHYFTLNEALGKVEGHRTARVTLSVADAPKSDEAGKKFQTLASDALRTFRTHAAATVTHAVSDGDGGIVAKASFLVENERWEGFAAAVAEEAKRHGEFDFDLTGPWPPYDFVQMQFDG